MQKFGSLCQNSERWIKFQPHLHFHLELDDASKSSLKVNFHIANLFLDPALKEPKHLPCLQTDSGAQFFMTDAAVKFLMSGIEDDSDIRDQVWIVFQLIKNNQ